MDNRDLADRVYLAQSSIHGQGLFTRFSLSKGEYIGTFTGPKTELDGMYVLWVMEPESGDVQYGIEGRNELRFMNHSRLANAIFVGELVYACASIEAGEEITIDYGEDW